MRWRTGIWAAVMLLAACAAPGGADNQPIQRDAAGRPDYAENYGLGRYVTRMVERRPDSDGAGSDILFFVTFSGGGKRSAAFGHGALRGLSGIPLQRPDVRPTSLLDAMDYLAGVSGGSFPAAHFGLYRERSFETFPTEFLQQDLNSRIWGIYLLPWNWRWILDPTTGTNDYMAAIYDQLMFRGATFADLIRQGQPVVSINATDITNGTTFPFLGNSFGLLCSDLNRFPIARAVAASNGFPGLFSPVTLRNHAAECGSARPPLTLPQVPPRSDADAAHRARLAALHARYSDAEATRYVHLMDGGIADNLAMRGLLNFFIALQADDALFRRASLRARRIIVLSVDGQAETPRQMAQQRSPGGLLQVISAASGTQIDAYNFETLILAREQVGHLTDHIREARCAQAAVIAGRPCGDVRSAFIHISLSDIADPALRQRLASIPTGLTIPAEDSAALVQLGEGLVRDNPDLRRMAAEAGFPALEAAAPQRRAR